MWCTHSWALPISFLSRVLEALTRKFTLHQDVSLYSIARKCPPNFTGADMYALCADAWFHAAKRKVGSWRTAGQKCIADDFVWFTILKLNGIYRDSPPPRFNPYFLLHSAALVKRCLYYLFPSLRFWVQIQNLRPLLIKLTLSLWSTMISLRYMAFEITREVAIIHHLMLIG